MFTEAEKLFENIVFTKLHDIHQILKCIISRKNQNIRNAVKDNDFYVKITETECRKLNIRIKRTDF